MNKEFLEKLNKLLNEYGYSEVKTYYDTCVEDDNKINLKCTLKSTQSVTIDVEMYNKLSEAFKYQRKLHQPIR